MNPLIYLGVTVAVAIFLIIATEIEWYGWATLTILASVIAVQYFHVFDILLFVKTNVLQSVIYTIAYIAIGACWSFAKWFFFLINERDKNRKWAEEQLKRTDFHFGNPKFTIPQASDNKERIVAWILYWPFSFIGTLLNDPLRKFANLIFNQFKTLYQRMADNIFKSDVYEFENQLQQLKNNKIK